jgi:hypothetical protein
MAKVLGDVDMYDAPRGAGNEYPGFLDGKNGTTGEAARMPGRQLVPD